MDIATLGLEIRSDGVVVAKDRLKDFDDQAGRTSKSTDMLVKAFGALAAVFSVAKLVQYTNTWTDLNSRVVIATGSISAGAATMERLTDMARRTYSALDQTAETFLLNARAMEDLGYQTGETLDFVEAINNALVVSGAKGERAASVVNALSKAMALGKLSGDQLETVLSTGGRVAEALADSLGVTTTALRQMGTDGKLTGDVIYAGLTSQLELLREEADSMPATIGDAFVLLNNSILAAVGTFDQMSGASSRVAETIIWVADMIDDGTLSIERMLAMATAMGVYMAGAWVVSFIAAYGAVASLTAGLTLLRTALIRTGVGALVVLAGELIYQLYKVVDGSRSVGDAFDRLKKSGVDTWERVVSAVQWFESVMNQVSDNVVSYMARKWGDLIQFIITQINQLQAAMGVQLFDSTAMNGLAEINLQAWERADAYAASAAKHGEVAAGHFASIFADKSTMTNDVGVMPGFGELGETMGAPANSNVPGSGSGAGGKADEYAKLTASIRENIDALLVEAETLGMTEFQATKLTTAQELLRAAAEAGRPITAGLIEDINALATQYAEAEQVIAGVQFAIGNPDPWDVMKEQLASLDIALAKGKISLEQYQAAAVRSMAGAAGSTIDSIGQITSVLAGAFEDNKALAVANAVVSTAGGVMKALEQGGMFGWPMAAAIAAAGAVQIGTILSASPGGGSSGSVSAPSASVPTVQNAPQRQQAERMPDRMDVTIQGLDRTRLYDGETVERMIQAIESASGDGRILNFKVA